MGLRYNQRLQDSLKAQPLGERGTIWNKIVKTFLELRKVHIYLSTILLYPCFSFFILPCYKLFSVCLLWA